MGSNLGNRLENLRCAKLRLEKQISNCVYSSIYESAALLPSGATEEWNLPFLNLVMRGETEMEPLPLLHFLKEIEKIIGRQDRGHWAPREIDLDILIYEDIAMQTAELTLPHPQMKARSFVMVPLAEISSEFHAEPDAELRKREDLCLHS